MNLVIYPIFFSDSADKELFLTLSAQGLGIAMAQTVAQECSCRVIIVTNENDVVRQAQVRNLGIWDAPDDSSEDAPGFPYGTGAAVRRLLNAPELLPEPSGAVAIVDFRAPDVTATHVYNILIKAMETPGLWLSLSEPEDHPIQFDAHLETLAVELHLKSNPDAPASDGLRVSCPFPMRLDESIDEGPVFQRLPAHGLGAGFETISKDAAIAEAQTETVIMRRTATAGCRVLGRSAPWPASALLPFAGRLDESRLLIISDPDNGFSVYARSINADTYRISIFPVTAGVIADSPAYEQWVVVTLPTLSVIRAGETLFHGPLLACPHLPCDGLLVVLERQTLEGHAERMTGFNLEPDVWRVEHDMTRINHDTELPVTGRQDFPEIWELDGGLLAVSAGAVDVLLKQNCIEGAYGYRMGVRSSTARALHLGLPLSSDTVGDDQEFPQ